MLKRFFQKQKPTTIIIIMFSLCLTTQIIQILWEIYKPKDDPSHKSVPALVTTAEQKSFRQPSPNQGTSVTEEKLELMARTAKSLLDSKKPLTRDDSLFIIHTHDLIESNNKTKISYQK